MTAKALPRLLGVTILVLFCAALACKPQRPEGPQWLSNLDRRQSHDLIAVLTPPAEEARKLVRALRSELSTDFDVHVFAADRTMSEQDVAAIMRDHRPSAVVLVDNPTVATYGKWARRQHSPPPSVIVMSSFAEELQRTIPNSRGISFEPPAVTSLTDVRRILEVPLKRVGVVYRHGFEDYVAREKLRAAGEKIELVAAPVRKRPTSAELHRALEKLKRQRVDGLWVSNDNGLLTRQLLQEAWLPFLERQHLPVIVGVPSLVSPGTKFGTFAAVPDIEGIGLQTADLIYAMAEKNWEPVGLMIQPPVSVKTFVDVDSARRLGMSSESELTVDVLVGRRDRNARAR